VNQVFWGANFSGRTFQIFDQNFLEKFGQLCGLALVNPTNIKILTPTFLGKIIPEVSGAENKFLLPIGVRDLHRR